MKAARPLLVTCVTLGEWTPEGGRVYQLDPGILDNPLEWDELDREGYDRAGGLGRYRVIRMMPTADEIERAATAKKLANELLWFDGE